MCVHKSTVLFFTQCCQEDEEAKTTRLFDILTLQRI